MVQQETKRAFKKLQKTNDIHAAASLLCKLKGVWPDMASAILTSGAPHSVPFMAEECLLAMPDMECLDFTMKEYMSLGESYERFVRKRTLVKYQFQSELIKMML